MVVGLSTTGTSAGRVIQQETPKTPTAPKTVSAKNRRLSTGSPPFPGTVPSSSALSRGANSLGGGTRDCFAILPITLP